MNSESSKLITALDNRTNPGEDGSLSEAEVRRRISARFRGVWRLWPATAVWHATHGPGVTEWQSGLGQPACGAQSNLNLSPEAARLHSVDSETGDWSVRSRRLPESLPPRLGLRGAARAALGTGTGSGKDPAVAPRDRTVTPGAPPSLGTTGTEL